jgi:DNA invertase Pin-like site-specific DNA recombinase
MKVAIYVRTSKTSQVLDNQLIPLEQYVQRMDWAYEVFKEQETTRKTRPVQWDLYNRLLRKEFDGLVIYKFDRWARSTKELITHMEEFKEKGIRFISYTENIDLGTSTGQLMFTIISAFAQFERDMIRERTLAGLERAKAQGKKLGRPRNKRGYVKKG